MKGKKGETRRKDMLKSLGVLIFTLTMVTGMASRSYAFTPEEEKQILRILGEIQGELRQLDRRVSNLERRMDRLETKMERRFQEMETKMERRFAASEQNLGARIEETSRTVRWVGLVMGGLTAAIIALVLWDRRTMLKAARLELEREYGLRDLRKVVEALRRWAEKNRELEAILRSVGLL